MASLMGWITELAPLRRKTKRVPLEKSLPPKRAPLPHRIPVRRRTEKLFLGLVFSAVTILVLAFPGSEGEPSGTATRVGSWLGIAVVTLLLNALFTRYISTFQREVAASFGRLLLFFLLALIVLVFARADTMSPAWPPLLVPLSLLATILAAVVNQRFAFEASTFLLPFLALILQDRYRGTDLLLHLFVPYAGSLAAVLSAHTIRRRSTLMKIGVVTGLVQVAALVGMVLVLEGPGEWKNLQMFFYGIGCAFMHGLAMGIVVLGILPILEYVFGVTTDVTLLELSDQYEQPVLKKLLLEAPGTHHHSMMVATLAQAAAERIGANSLLARVGAIYHDIGKLNKPEYFAENDEETAQSLHEALTPAMSTLVICAHPKDGMELGRYYDLPPAVLEFVEQHHGDTLVEFFYDKARRLQNVSDTLDESRFRYPGPRPKTKEVGIVMLADCVEAASRGLNEPNPARIEGLIHDLVMKRLLDHQLDDCALTLRELSAIEDAFYQVLMGVFHKRPVYPESAGLGQKRAGGMEGGAPGDREGPRSGKRKSGTGDRKKGEVDGAGDKNSGDREPAGTGVEGSVGELFS